MRSDNYRREMQNRCPECKSCDIHKRVRRDHTKEMKIYKCYVCKHEFNIPFFGPRKVKDGEGEKTKE